MLRSEEMMLMGKEKRRRRMWEGSRSYIHKS